MDVFEKILSEIDKGIKTIEPLMRGETRQIAENQIIGLEEAKKIVEKYKADSGWIPVGQRPPENEEYETYLCTLDGELCGTEEPFTGMCGYEKGKWDEEGCVIAWQPLPDPYRPEEKKKRRV